MSFKCFNCNTEVNQQPFKVPAETKMSEGTVKIDGEVKPTVLQHVVKLCDICSRPYRSVHIRTNINR